MKLSKPKTQLSEVLYELLTNESINRREIMLNTGILNVTARISNLRTKHNLEVFCNSVKVKNKHGRTITYGKWFIPKFDIEKAQQIYLQINK